MSILDSFRNPSTGTFDDVGSKKAGLFEATTTSQPSSQQPNESWQSFTTRTGAYDSAKGTNK